MTYPPEDVLNAKRAMMSLGEFESQVFLMLCSSDSWLTAEKIRGRFHHVGIVELNRTLELLQSLSLIIGLTRSSDYYDQFPDEPRQRRYAETGLSEATRRTT